MPQARGVQKVQKGAWATGLGRIGGNIINMKRQQLEQELAGREKEEQNLAKAMKIMKDLGLEDSPRFRELGMQRLGGLVPGFEETMLQQPVRHTPMGDLETKPFMRPRLPSEVRARTSPAYRAEVTARAKRPQVTPGALRTRLTSLYDKEKEKAVALDAKIATKRLTLPEPKAGVLGMFSNQAEIDSIQGEIDILKQQRAKIQSNMDRVTSEGRKRFGKDIIFEIPQIKPVKPDERMFTKEEFIQDFKREEGREPTERDLNMLQGIVWE